MNKILNKTGLKKLVKFLESEVPGISKKFIVENGSIKVGNLKLFVGISEDVTDTPPASIPTVSQASIPNPGSDSAQQPSTIPPQTADEKTAIYDQAKTTDGAMTELIKQLGTKFASKDDFGNLQKKFDTMNKPNQLQQALSVVGQGLKK